MTELERKVVEFIIFKGRCVTHSTILSNKKLRILEFLSDHSLSINFFKARCKWFIIDRTVGEYMITLTDNILIPVRQNLTKSSSSLQDSSTCENTGMSETKHSAVKRPVSKSTLHEQKCCTAEPKKSTYRVPSPPNDGLHDCQLKPENLKNAADVDVVSTKPEGMTMTRGTHPATCTK